MGFFQKFAARMSEPVQDVPFQASWDQLRELAYGGKLPGDTGSEEAAWGFYNTVPELHAGVNTTAAVISRMNYAVFERTETGLRPVKDPRVLTPVIELFDGGVAQVMTADGRLTQVQRMGQGPLIRNMALNYMVPGRMLLIRIGGIWNVYSCDQVSINPGTATTGGTVTIQTLNGANIYRQEDVQIRSLIRPHPQNPSLWDSPVRSLGVTLDTIKVLTGVIRGAGYSRLFWGSILHVSDKFRTPRLNAASAVQYGNDYFTYALNEKMNEQLRDANNAPKPIIVSGPDSAEIKSIKVYDDLPENAEQLMRLMWQRVAVGLDVPAELLTGENMSSHLARWQVEESIVKLHGETTGQEIATALKLLIFDDIWASMGYDPDKFVIKVDASSLSKRPLSNLEKLNLLSGVAELTGMTLRAEDILREFDIYPDALVDAQATKVPPAATPAPNLTGRNRVFNPDTEDTALERGMPDDVSAPTRLQRERIYS